MQPRRSSVWAALNFFPLVCRRRYRRRSDWCMGLPQPVVVGAPPGQTRNPLRTLVPIWAATDLAMMVGCWRKSHIRGGSAAEAQPHRREGRPGPQFSPLAHDGTVRDYSFTADKARLRGASPSKSKSGRRYAQQAHLTGDGWRYPGAGPRWSIQPDINITALPQQHKPQWPSPRPVIVRVLRSRSSRVASSAGRHTDCLSRTNSISAR